MKKTISLIIHCLFAIHLFAQQDSSSYPYWIKMMEDPNANYYQTIRAFNKFYEGKDMSKEKGWKNFKRWEYYWKNRVDSLGFRKPIHVYSTQECLRSSYGEWINIGPPADKLKSDDFPPGVGKINSLAFHPTDSNILLAGSENGGIWKSTNGGLSWKVTSTDNLMNMHINKIRFSSKNPKIVYAGNGSRRYNPSNKGVLRSDDGGDTWIATSKTISNNVINDIWIDPKNENHVFIASESGLFDSYDGGKTSIKYKISLNEIIPHPLKNNIFYGSNDAGVFVSIDTGKTWNNLFIKGERNRFVIHPKYPNIMVYLAANYNDFNSIFVTVDEGKNFTKMSDTPNILGYDFLGKDYGSGHAWHDLALAINPDKPNEIYVGGINVFKSIDTGKTWKCMGAWSKNDLNIPMIHADQQFFQFHPITKQLFVTNDGGIFKLEKDNLWKFCSNGIVNGQIYKISQATHSANEFLIGLQDNGFVKQIDTNNCQFLDGGDGMYSVYNPNNPNNFYYEFQYGHLYRYTSKNGIEEILDTFDRPNLNGSWISLLLGSTVDSNFILTLKKDIRYTSNAYDKIPVFKSPIGLTSTYGGFDVIKQSYVNPNQYIGTYRDTLIKLLKIKNELYVTEFRKRFDRYDDLEPDGKDSNILWGVYKTYLGKHDLKNNNYSFSKFLDWTSDNSKAIIIQDLRSKHGNYIGTDYGVFYQDYFMDTTFVNYSHNLPAAPDITDIKIYYDKECSLNDRLAVSTYGRGLWQSNLYRNLNMYKGSINLLDTLLSVDSATRMHVNTGMEYDSVHWTITPTSYSFVNGTNASSKIPEIKFNTSQEYRIQAYIKGNDYNFCNYTLQKKVQVIGRSLQVYVGQNSKQLTIVSPVPGTALIYNAIGQLVFSGNFVFGTNTIDLSSLVSGIYIVKAMGNNIEPQSLKFGLE